MSTKWQEPTLGVFSERCPSCSVVCHKRELIVYQTEAVNRAKNPL